jgi:hypothetical protein
MIEVRIKALLASLGVHNEAWIIELPASLLESGEPLLAFETLIDNLYDAQAPIFRGEVCEIEFLGEYLKSNRQAWHLIHQLEIKP